MTYFVFYKSNFAQMPISRENMNVPCSYLITMIPEWNYFIFMQTDYPRWPTGTVTKNSINTKMTISQDTLVEIDSTLCQNVSCMKPLYFLQFWIPRWLSFAVTKISAEHENDNISVIAQWTLTKCVSE